MMSGLPGSGKSTVAHQLVEAVGSNAQIIATDIVRKELFTTPTYQDEENTQVHHEVQRRLIAQLHQGKTVIYDATNLRVQFRAWVEVAQATTGCKLLIIETTADEDTIKQRLIARQQQGNSASDADYSIYLLLKESAEPIERPHLTIRTDTHHAQDLRDAIRVINLIATQ